MIEDKYVLIDTNILIYAFDKSEKEKYKIAKEILKEGFKIRKNLAFSLQNLAEFFFVSTVHLDQPIEKDLAKKIVRKISEFKLFKIIKPNKNTLISAIDINIKYNLHFWDSVIAAVMQENNINTILTEDEDDFKRIPWLKVINPFMKQSESEENKN